LNFSAWGGFWEQKSATEGCFRRVSAGSGGKNQFIKQQDRF